MIDFENYFDTNPAIMLLIDSENGQIAKANKSASDFYGYTIDELGTLNISDINILPRVECLKQVKKIAKKELANCNFKHRLKDNSIKDVKILATPIEVDKHIMNVAIIEDISVELKNLEELKKYYKIVDESLAFIGVANKEREVVYLNKAFKKAIGINNNEDLSKYKTSDLYTKEAVNKNAKLYKKSILNGGNWIGENELKALDGTIIPVIQSGIVVKDSSNNIDFTSITAFDISQKKAAETKLIQSEKFYKSLFDNLNGFAYCKLLYKNGKANDFEYVLVNRAFEDLTGLKEVCGKRVSEVIPGILEKDFALIRHYADVVETGIPRSFEIFLESMNKWFSVSVISTDSSHFMVSFDVIDERKKHEKLIQSSLRRYKALLEISKDGIHVIDKAGKIIEVNDAFCDMLGYSKAEILNLNLNQIDVNFSKDELLDKIEEVIKNNSIIETKHRKKYGTIIDVEVNTAVLSYEGVDYLYCSSRDISERVKAEKISDEALNRLNKIASRVPGVLYQYVLRTDGTSYFPYASEGVRDIYNVSPKEIIEDASVVFNRIHKDDLEGVIKSINVSAKNLTPWQYEYRVQEDDGTIHLLYGNSIPQKQPDGEILWHGFITDITEQKKAEKALLELSDRFKHFFDLHSAVMLLIDPDSNNILDANISASNFYGYTRIELQQMKITDINILKPEEVKREMELAVNEKRNYFVFKHKLSNGELIPVEVHSTPILFDGKKTLFSIIHDISLKEKSEQQVKEYTNKLERMNADLDSFAYVASHDLKAPLNVVNGFLGLINSKKDSLSKESRDEYLKYIQDAVNQMKLLINDLLHFSRIGSNKDSFVMVDVNHLLISIQDVLAETIHKSNATVTIQPLPTISANKTLLNELFMNLLGNALKYHKSDQEVLIEVGYQETPEYHQFFVKDNGIGIATENLGKVFVMFKRLHTQTEFEGTGIGLSLCKRIVEAHNGQIWVESVLGEGSTFYFTIKK